MPSEGKNSIIRRRHPSRAGLWAILFLPLLGSPSAWAGDEHHQSSSLRHPLQRFLCESELNPGFQAYHRIKKSGPPSCQAKEKSPSDELYCSELAATNQSLRSHGLRESEFLKFELQQELRKQIRSSSALAVARRAYEEYKTQITPSEAIGCRSSPALLELRRKEALTQLTERMACLSGNRRFAEDLARNMADQAQGESISVFLSRVFGSRRTLLEIAHEYSGAAPLQSPLLHENDLVFLSPTLHHYYLKNINTQRKRDKMCYYATSLLDTHHEEREELHELDKSLLTTGVASAVAGSILLGKDAHSKQGHRLHKISEASAWAASYVFAYRATRNFLNAIYPQDSLSQLSLFLDTNPFDNRCRNTSLIPDFLDGVITKSDDRNEALLWQSLSEVAAAFCISKCVEVGAHALRASAPAFALAKREILSVIESKRFLRENFHRIDWSRATPAIVERTRVFLREHPELIETMEKAADIEIGRVLIGSTAVRAAARGGQEFLAGAAAATFSDDTDVHSFDPEQPWSEAQQKEAEACALPIPSDRASLYVKYLTRERKRKRDPSDCLLIGQKR